MPNSKKPPLKASPDQRKALKLAGLIYPGEDTGILSRIKRHFQTRNIIKTLHSEGVAAFYPALEIAKESPDNKLMAQVLDWAIAYLKLNEIGYAAEMRKNELLTQRMPGMVSGGMAGMSDPNLSSVYGQILLQSAQALDGRAPISPLLLTGRPLLDAAAATDYPHLPGIASEVLREWQDQSSSS